MGKHLRRIFGRHTKTVSILAGAFLIGFLTVCGSRLVWLKNDDAIEAYLKRKIRTDYKYFVLQKIEKAPFGPHPIAGYTAPEDGSFFRFFRIYAYDPKTTSERSNIALLGYVKAGGKIKIFYHGNPLWWNPV